MRESLSKNTPCVRNSEKCENSFRRGGVEHDPQKRGRIIYNNARIAQLVEHDLAKVGVAGSNPVSRSSIARVVESVDTPDLKSCACMGVRVQVPLRVQKPEWVWERERIHELWFFSSLQRSNSHFKWIKTKTWGHTQTCFNLKRKYPNHCCPTKTNFIFYVIGITLVYGPHRGLTFVTLNSPENKRPHRGRTILFRNRLSFLIVQVNSKISQGQPLLWLIHFIYCSHYTPG